MSTPDALTLEILWRRLITIADEMAAVVVRTSFSTVVGAANDFGCEVMDAEGRSLAHATRSMPAFNRTMPNVTRAVLEKFGPGGIRPGDVFIANDPWLNASHHPDLAIITPFFLENRLMGFTGSIAHVADFGGALDGNQVREVYEEGLLVPMTWLYKESDLNALVIDFIAANVRAAEAVIGDIHALVAANQAGAERILALMEEYALDDLAPLAKEIQRRGEVAMRRAISEVPDGVYRSHIQVDEFETPISIHCAVTVQGDEVTVDFSGTSPQQPRGGINVAWVFSRAYITYGLKCILLPEVPSNAGCYRPFHLMAPEGCILNAQHPASVRMRSRTAWYIHHALFKALADVLPDRVMAGPGFLSTAIVYAHNRENGKYSHSWFFNGGGMGAGSQTDGVSACIYPSSASNVPIELFEVAVPLLVEQKEFLPGSAGAGRQRGGLGQRTVLRLLDSFNGTATLAFWLHSQNVPPFGLHGGGASRVAEAFIDEQVLGHDEKVWRLGALVLEGPSISVGFETAGGAGFGRPEERPAILVQRDVRDGLISHEEALNVYGVVLERQTGALDEAATALRRQRRRGGSRR